MARGKGTLAKGINVHWNKDNDRKLLLQIIDKCSKNYDTAKLAELFPGATRKAIEERIAKLKREAKATSDPSGASAAAPRKRKNPTEGDDDAEGSPTPKKRTTKLLSRKVRDSVLHTRSKSPVTASLYPLPKVEGSGTDSGLSDINSVISCAEKAVAVVAGKAFIKGKTKNDLPGQETKP